jgi:uncharacterized protein (TIGR03437 family)
MISAVLLGQSAPLPTYTITSIAGSSLVGDGGQAVVAQLSSVEGLAVDSAGNLYIADSTDHRIRKVAAASGLISTIAGNGHAGVGADSGVAAATQLHSPYGIALDRAGNLYVADFGNVRVRRISADGSIRTIAGGGTRRVVGEGTDALGARFVGPRNVAVDGSGNLYISDYSDHRVYRVSPSGQISPFAGTGEPGSNGDGPATSSQLNFPAGLAVDRNGTVYIADSGNKTVRRVMHGQMTTVLGGTVDGFQLGAPTGLAMDAAGNLYVADGGQNRVFQWTSAGGVSSEAGSEPELTGPTRDVAADLAGNLYIANGRQVLRQAPNRAPEPFAGDGTFGQAKENIPALESYLAGPIGVTVDPAGNVYVVEEQARRVRRIDYMGNIRTIAGSASAKLLGDGGPATAARLLDPVGVAADPWGGVRISDYLGNRVRGVMGEGIMFTAAGDGTAGSSGDGGPAQMARVNHPRGLAFDRDGNLYIADSLNHRVRRIGINGYITTVAGTGVRGYYGDGGPAKQAHLNAPLGVFVDGAGNLYIADSGNHAIRKVNPAGIISTIAGSGARGYGGDNGPAILAWFYAPSSVAADSAGNVFVADTFNHRVRRVSAEGVVTTIAGDGAPGFTGDGGAAESARLRSPASLGIDLGGRIYVADLDNNRIRLLTPAAAPLPPPELIAEVVVMNAASFRSGPVAAGQLISIFGETVPENSPVVRVGGHTAPVFAAVVGQVNSRIPEEMAGRAEVEVEVLAGGKVRGRSRVPLAAAAPGLFTVQRGVGQIIAVHEDGSLNAAEHPASRGSIVVLYATGHGEVDSEGRVTLPVQLKIGNASAEVLYAGAAPGFQGLMQINAKLPGMFTAPGTHAVTLWLGEAASQPGVTITVK